MTRPAAIGIVTLAAALWLVLKDGDWGTTIPRFLALWAVAALGTAIVALPLDHLARRRTALRIAAWTAIGFTGGWLANGQTVGLPVPAFAALGALAGSVLVLLDKRAGKP